MGWIEWLRCEGLVGARFAILAVCGVAIRISHSGRTGTLNLRKTTSFTHPIAIPSAPVNNTI